MMHVAFPLVAGSDRHPHNVLHERHSSRLPAGDEAPPFQEVGASPKCDGTDAYRYGQTHLLAAIVREFLAWFQQPGMDRGAPPGAGGADRGNRVPARDEQRGRKVARVMSIQWLSRNRKHMDEEPDLIVIDEAHHALAETYRILWENYPEARKLGMTATPLPAERQGIHGLVRQPDCFVDCRGIHRKGLVVIL